LWSCLVLLEEVSQEVLHGFPLTVKESSISLTGIDLGDVTSNRHNVCIEGAEFGPDVHEGCPGIDVGLPNENLEEGNSTWILSNVVVLGVDHCPCLDFGCIGGSWTCVQHEAVLGCMSLGIDIGGHMGSDLIQGDLPIVCKDGLSWPHWDCGIDGYVKNVSPAACHCAVCKGYEEDLEAVCL